MMNLQPQAVAPASPSAPAAPAARHRTPEATRESFSQTLDEAVSAETQPPERSPAATRPAQGADSARERRLAQATKPSEPRRPEPEAAARLAAEASDSAQTEDTSPADDASPASHATPDNLGALLTQLRLSAAGVQAGTRSAASAAESEEPGADSPGAGLPDAPRLATAGSRQTPAATSTDRATSTSTATAKADLAAGAGGTPAAFDEHLARAGVVATDPTARAAEALPPAAGPWSTGAAGSGTVPTASTAPAGAALSAHPGSADFGTQLGAQITTFVRDGVEHAQLHLNPADMGPVSVRIQLEGATAVVHLGADQAGTRQALEQALPLLAASLREAGLTLTGGGVFEQARQGNGTDAGAGDRPRGDGREGRDGRGGDGGGDSGRAGTGAAEMRTLPERRRGVVDLIA